MSQKDLDILILGAGLSGIGAACHVRRKLKNMSFAVLERRQAIGGTWDLFRYPGIRSDSDMTTFGYNFRPWNAPKVLADGHAIREYITNTARDHKITPHIQFGRKVIKSEWSSQDKRWTVTTLDEDSGKTETWRSRFLIAATGYYNYDHGYAPDFPGAQDFKGQIVHPQHWPENLQVKDKKICVIGSGATAITLVPSLAKLGAQVTMLQRTPTYVLSVPEIDPLWKNLSRVLPSKAVYAATRARNIALQRSLFMAARARPKVVRRFLRQRTKAALRGKVDVKHFLPDYNPWDQRLCVVPRGDLFRSLREGQAQIRTDHIKNFDATGIELKSGEHIEADIIISATGLELQLMGGSKMFIDGEEMKINERMVYKGMLLENVPNMLLVTGYTNASWTLKSDIVSEHFCRLIKHMEKSGKSVMKPTPNKASRLDVTVMGSLESGYVARGADELPRQGDTSPWVLLNDYVRDAAKLKFGSIKNRDLTFA